MHAHILFLLLTLCSFRSLEKFTQNDLISWPRPEGFKLCPNNTHAFYLTKQFDIKSMKTRVKAYLTFIKQKKGSYKTETVEVTSKLGKHIKHLENSFEFVWLNDETLLFVKDNKLFVIDSVFSKKYNIYKIQNFNKNNIHTDIGSLKYNQHTSSLFFSAKVHPYGINNATEITKKHEEGSGLLFKKLMVRHWDVYTTPAVVHVFLLKIECFHDNNSGSKVKTCKAEDRANDVVENKLLESPTAPYFEASDYDVSPQGENVVFVSKNPEQNGAWSTSMNVYISSTDGKTPPRLIHSSVGQVSSPVFSENGDLVWLEKFTPQYESARNEVVICKTDKKTILFKSFDRSPSKIMYSQSSDELLALVEDEGYIRLYSMNLKSQKTGLIIKHFKKTISDLFLYKDYGVAFQASSIDSPPEYYLYEFNSKNPIQITTINTYKYTKSLVKAQEKWFVGALNDNIHTFILFPPNYNERFYYPAAMLIHGGPEGSWLNQWSYRWNPNIFANAGYIVLMINFHGSTGYGQKFTDSIKENWGSYPYEDIMTGLDVFTDKIDSIDERRVCALGASYGGYMINWINGHTQRFRCLVNHDGMFSTTHSYYTTDELYFNEHEFGGTPWESHEIYEKYSPSNHVFKWSTPTMVVHSGKDYRLDLSEGIATFTALQRLGVKSQFLYFPDENHWILKPLNSLQWHNEVLDWINIFCRPMITQKEPKQKHPFLIE